MPEPDFKSPTLGLPVSQPQTAGPVAARAAPSAAETTVDRVKDLTGNAASRPNPVPQFKDQPLAAIGLILSNVAAGMQGRPLPSEELQRRQLENEAFELRKMTIGVGALKQVQAMLPQVEEAERDDFVRRFLSGFETVLPGITETALLTVKQPNAEALLDAVGEHAAVLRSVCGDDVECIAEMAGNKTFIGRLDDRADAFNLGPVKEKINLMTQVTGLDIGTITVPDVLAGNNQLPERLRFSASEIGTIRRNAGKLGFKTEDIITAERKAQITARAQEGAKVPAFVKLQRERSRALREGRSQDAAELQKKIDKESSGAGSTKELAFMQDRRRNLQDQIRGEEASPEPDESELSLLNTEVKEVNDRIETLTKNLQTTESAAERARRKKEEQTEVEVEAELKESKAAVFKMVRRGAALVKTLEKDGAKVIGLTGIAARITNAFGEQAEAILKTVELIDETEGGPIDRRDLEKRLDFSILGDQAAESAKVRSATLSLAVLLAKTAEPGARQLSDEDVQRQIDIIGGGTGSASQFAAVLKSAITASIKDVELDFKARLDRDIDLFDEARKAKLDVDSIFAGDGGGGEALTETDRQILAKPDAEIDEADIQNLSPAAMEELRKRLGGQ